jgi:hypothetical protein
MNGHIFIFVLYGPELLLLGARLVPWPIPFPDNFAPDYHI